MIAPPKKSADFDNFYRSSIKHWIWTDVRIPSELKVLIRALPKKSRVLELGCGTGRYSRYVAQQRLDATGVDFSLIAIDKARNLVASDDTKPDYQVGEVTKLANLDEPFDASFDIGCFHCLDTQEQESYALEVARLLKPGSSHLIWALDTAPSGLSLSPLAVRNVFAPSFTLQNAQKSRRRIFFVPSHWYWLVRKD